MQRLQLRDEARDVLLLQPDREYCIAAINEKQSRAVRSQFHVEYRVVAEVL